MIDIHAHIIPGVDDGPDSVDTALEMLEIAEADNIGTIVAAPHTFSFASVYKNPEPLREKFFQFKKEAEKMSVKIELLQGAENFFDSRLRDHLREFPDLLTINGSDYFLLEFPVDFIFPGTRQFIYNVMSDGFIPIICHPERNRRFREGPSLLYEFMQIGALSQVTAGSFRGDFGADARAAAHYFLKCNLVNVIASDSHNTRQRRPEMGFLYRELKETDPRTVDMLTRVVPKAIIDNQAPPDTGTLIDPTRKTSFFAIFKEMFNRN